MFGFAVGGVKVGENGLKVWQAGGIERREVCHWQIEKAIEKYLFSPFDKSC